MTEAPVRLRAAILDDASTLNRWERAPHIKAVMGVHPRPDWVQELARDVPGWEVLIAEALDQPINRPIGAMEILDLTQDEERYWAPYLYRHPDATSDALRAIDIWIGEADCLGKGYGTQMMRLALTRCFADPDVTAVLLDPLDSNLDARRFYERLGFENQGLCQFGLDACAVYCLDRCTWV